jgi:hypothetical protein
MGINSEKTVEENEIKKFSNGFSFKCIHTRSDRESRDGVSLTNHYYDYQLLDDIGNIIFSDNNSSENYDYLSDFIENYLVIKGGVINTEGEIVIPFNYNQSEARHRLILKIGMNFTDKEMITEYKCNQITYKERKSSFLNIRKTANFVKNLITEFENINQIIYFLQLRRESYISHNIYYPKKHRYHHSYIKKEYKLDPRKRIPYSDAEFLISEFDILYILIQISHLSNIQIELNLDRKFTYIKDDLISYFETESHIINNRIFKLNELISSFNLSELNIKDVRNIRYKYEQRFKNISPLYKNCKLKCYSHLTLKSQYLKNERIYKNNLPISIQCILSKKATFLNPKEYNECYIIENIVNKELFLVKRENLEVDLKSFTFEDFCDFLQNKLL